ncbi:hypothetical protein JCM3770_001703 [Rhodotorula araucariae]
MVKFELAPRASSALLGHPANHGRRSPARHCAVVAALILLVLGVGGYLHARGLPDLRPLLAEGSVDPVSKEYGVPQVEPGRTITFRSYLDAVLGPTASDSVAHTIGQLWLTAADHASVTTWAAKLAARVAAMNEDRPEHARVVIVALCGDSECLQECRRRDWRCYGGFQRTKPPKQGIRAWMQVSGIVDVLASGRDVLYVHPGVAVLDDPLPDVSAASQAADLVAAPQAFSDAISASFVWTRSTPATRRIWHDVLDEVASTADRSVDWLLGEALKAESPRDESGPLAGSSAVTVKLLDDSRYGGRQDSRVEDVPPVVIPVDCAGDDVMQDYVAKAEGYSTTEAYYNSGQRTLILPELAGTREELEQFLRIAVTAAAVLHRALEPPSSVSILSSPSNSSSSLHTSLTLPLHDVLPLPYLSNALDVPLVPSGFSRPRIDAEFDLGTPESIFDLVRALSRWPFEHAPAVRLVGAGGRGPANWRTWAHETLPAASRVVALCDDVPPRRAGTGTGGEGAGRRKAQCVPRGCAPPDEWIAALAPGEREGASLGALRVQAVRRRVDAPWPALDEMLLEGGFKKWP